MNSPRNRTLATVALAAVLLALSTEAFAQLVVPRVTFQSDVRGATVLVNGQRRGTTPLTLNLRAGSYTVRLQAPNRTAVTRTIRVDQTGRQTFQIDFATTPRRAATRQVTINSNVPASVSIDGQNRGNTPLVLPIVAGRYQLQLSASGYIPTSLALTVSNQARQSYSFELTPALATLLVDVPDQFLNKRLSDVAAARGQVQLFVDGQQMNAAGRGVQVVAGSHTITLLSGGFGLTQQVDLQPGLEYTVRLFASMEVLQTGVVRIQPQVQPAQGRGR